VVLETMADALGTPIDQEDALVSHLNDGIRWTNRYLPPTQRQPTGQTLDGLIQDALVSWERFRSRLTDIIEDLSCDRRRRG